MPDYSLARFKQVFGLSGAEASLAIGLVGPVAYVIGYMILFNTGVDASLSRGDAGLPWTIAAATWMLGLPLVAILGVIAGFRGRTGPSPLVAAAGLVCNSLWLLAWAYLLALLASGASA